MDKNILLLPRWLLSQNRQVKRGITLLFDVVALLLALWLSFSLRLGELYSPDYNVGYLFAVAPFLAIPIFIKLGLYRAIIRYLGFYSLWVVVKAVSLYTLMLAVVVLLAKIDGVPRSVHVINWLLVLLGVGGSRMIARWWFAGLLDGSKKLSSVHKMVIYGAGSSGVQLADQLSLRNDIVVAGFIDDDESLHRRQIHNLRVFPFTHLSRLVERHGVTDILLAMPSVSRQRRQQIITLLEPYPLKVKTLPTLAEIAKGEVTVNDIRDVEIEDLLGRDPVAPNEGLMGKNITGKTVMVTGAGGSIGSELCRQILRLQPRELILFENSEYALYTLDKELDHMHELLGFDAAVKVVPVLGSVFNRSRIANACLECGVQTLYHAAAYKHVPLVEQNPSEAIQNNVFGTLYAAQAAIAANVASFILISTDKAVRPTNTMGASKRMAELVLQALDCEASNTQFSMVRFGNVLGSSGSVIPLFKKQIKQGGPVTVTDPKIIRYFMTIPEAAQLVIQAGAMAKGGDVFVLDMGEPVNILDLARKMIHLSGREVRDENQPNGDIEIEYTGLRPGEKLYEELLIGNNVSPTGHVKIMRASESMLPWDKLNDVLNELEVSLGKGDYRLMRKVLMGIVSGYQPQCDIQDVVSSDERVQVDISPKAKVVKI
ncbi:MAG: polysaccharide biosynthesis protein [Piscirickettsiaceae bacterium]|nr:MAG: polysaccharide biosynthesis protein [Piscirickettsiaceae bacterium]PCI71382.1 MAG: polysaccharide biosynthesis protein [Piscirickettsiaceae bacterium]